MLALVALVGSTVGWAAQVPQPATLDPGQTTASSSVRDGLLAEALPLIAKAGYDLKEFNFTMALVEPHDRALFVPVQDSPEKLKRLPALIGLLYVREALQIVGQALQRGLYPVLDSSTISAPQSSLLQKSGWLVTADGWCEFVTPISRQD